MSAVKKFLSDFQARPLPESPDSRLKPEKLVLGQGQPALEVVVLSADQKPHSTTLKTAYKKRKNNRSAPVLLTVLHGEKADLCGPAGDNPPVRPNIHLKVVEDFCRTALKKPNRHQAERFCSHFGPSIETKLCGLHNRGLLSDHHLVHGVKNRSDWELSKAQAKEISYLEREDLLKGLGFEISPMDNNNLTYILKSKDKKRALAVLLTPMENHETKQARFNELSPVRYAMDKADQENMPYVLMVKDNHLRLYRTQAEESANLNDRTENYIGCQPSLLQKENLGYLWLIFSAKALSAEGSLHEILENSKRFAESATQDLKKRIYDEIIPQIANGIFQAKKQKISSYKELQKIYEMTLTVLFRLLFIAYAEDKDYLPYKTNELYRRRSLKQRAGELSKPHSSSAEWGTSDNHYQETVRLWKAIDKGNTEWGIMPYNGGLFSSEKNISEIGFELSKISIPDKFFAPALKSLLLMETSEGRLAPVDFRFIGPKDFGTIYEGLLESSLSVANENLILDKNNIYTPVKSKAMKTKPLKTKGQQPSKIISFRGPQNMVVKKGEVYLHNQSGARKATGSYYTKKFAVEHILDKSLEPALKKHFERLNKMEEKQAGKEFFNFFVADISMGSGHFLVSAVDRIEKAMADYLDKRPLKGVQNILNKMEKTAKQNLATLSPAQTINGRAQQAGLNPTDESSFENRKLLARHIAKHCIYGVDNNHLAVQLAKLSLWSHTFVPGLHLSYFNHNLVCGNSLVGIGTLEELKEDLSSHQKDTGQLSGDLIDKEKLIGMAKKPLQDMRKQADLDSKDVKKSRTLQKEIELALKDSKALLDILLFNRITNKVSGFKLVEWVKNSQKIRKSKEWQEAHKELQSLKALHFPVAFPEVFLRDRPGFDVIIGNPPWEKIKLEEHAFWARHFPGLRGLSQREREAKCLQIKKEYPALVTQYQQELSHINKLKDILKKAVQAQSSSGDSDLYKFFSWRFWNLVCEKNGFLGVVLKGSVCQAEGSQKFREEIFQKAKVHITTYVNNLGWVFEGVDGIRISIVSLEKQNETDLLLSEQQKSSQQQKNYQIKNSRQTNLESNPSKAICVQGPFRSLEEFQAEKNKIPLSFTKKEVLSWTDSAVLPSLPREDSLDVFLQMRRHPRLDLNDGKSWRARPDTELHTTGSKFLMDLKSKKCPKGFWPVWTGRSFNIWKSDTKQYYAYAEPDKAIDRLYKKRINGHKNRKSTHSEFSTEYVRDESTLPCFRPRIAFRDIGSADRPRTIHTSLVPPKIFLVHKAPYLLFSRGDEKDKAFLLGVLSSMPLDWYARLFISTNNIGFFLLNTFPVPRPDRSHLLWKRAVALSGCLASPDSRFANWAKAVGVEYGSLDQKTKDNMIHELDAVVAHLYGLSETQLIHIFDTFHKNPDYYAPRKQAVLAHFRAWQKKQNVPKP